MKDKFNYWLLLFILLLLLVPILSVEGLIPWFIFFFFTSLCIKEGKKERSISKKLINCFTYCLIASAAGLLFNLLVTQGTKLVVSIFL